MEEIWAIDSFSVSMLKMPWTQGSMCELPVSDFDSVTTPDCADAGPASTMKVLGVDDSADLSVVARS